jgi:hypothetical protein
MILPPTFKKSKAPTDCWKSKMNQREATKQRKKEVRRATRNARLRTVMATWPKIMANLTSSNWQKEKHGYTLLQVCSPMIDLHGMRK